VDRVRFPFLSQQLGQRRTWLLATALATMTAVAALGFADPSASIRTVAYAAIAPGICGATFDIVIDAYRIELLDPEQLGTGSGMSPYGWRIGASLVAALALTVAARSNWTVGSIAYAPLALSALFVSLIMGEPRRRREMAPRRGAIAVINAFFAPLKDFFSRQGAVVVLLFVLVHKIGDTMANLMIRDLLVGAGFTKDEIAFGDVGVERIVGTSGVPGVESRRAERQGMSYSEYHAAGPFRLRNGQFPGLHSGGLAA
jgi:PAT family beta-lactamase induction signal transducer AmpG